ncbi:hypothetical protein DFQ26_001570, partial [Actinomortierella ambigua]
MFGDPGLSLEDVDALGEELEDEGEQTSDPTAEPSRKRLRALQTITKTLIESRQITGDVTPDDVKEHAFKNDDLTQQEIDTIVKITNELRPYVPKRCLAKQGGERAHTPHVVTRAPIVMIANAVLRATGYSQFTRRLAPQVSGMAVNSLHLGVNTVYEALCSAEANQFDADDANGIMFRSPAQAMNSKENKRALYSAFFNMERVDSICKAHGLVFADRMMFVDRYTVRILGRVVKHHEQYPGDADENRRHRANMTDAQVDKKANDASAAVKAKEAEINPLRKTVDNLQKTLAALRRRQAAPFDRQEVTEHLKEERRKLLKLQEELRKLRGQSYYWNKVSQAPRSNLSSSRRSGGGAAKHTVATWGQPTVEDHAQLLDIDDLAKHDENKDGQYPNKHIVFAGTDYGIRTMSETVALTGDEYNTFINRYKPATQ